MKQKIQDAFLEHQIDFESEMFLRYLLKGGYELEARNLLNIRCCEKEVQVAPHKVADLIYSKKRPLQNESDQNNNIDIIEFGHDGTWQTQTNKTGLINKAKQDYNKYAGLPNVDFIYQVLLLTDIKKTNIVKIRLMENYLDSKKALIQNPELAKKRINTVVSGLMKIDPQLIHGCFTNTNHGFEVDMHWFILSNINNSSIC